MYHGMYGYGVFAFPWIPLIFVVAFVALTIAGIVALLRLSKRGGSGNARGERDISDALDIMVERFARGEIDADQFRAMKAEIEKK